MKYILICLFLLGCQHPSKSPIKAEGELWLIDPADIEIKRHLKNGDEERIPIRENDEMFNFVCMDTDYYAQLLLNLYKGCD